ncbi:gliding motility-associated ABC transporter substrate-binding protein GldG [Hymenobacter busanensis]|uniref:Gliding motility-associated ABC transporter substrate-binding protein GldG n=1 Tax=Hymenobacter busanensis TaxID=2607656 RepID=A0A7L4ZUH2_9BACT|nr:gliding motility-associated ABC transporter substrate-binding protein GldG [Hymenobacter busanensis]KAA9339422.1 gliding motility-associated ABC transporter substrate-binding protein GldG [Hymenobacter busanensis]QHJ06818.1 gliding motility-associated ABC transporter substrate-binding protein GldG [Hymenobacter busanensis]
METTPAATPAPVAPAAATPRKQRDLLRFGLIILGLVVLNFVAQQFFFRLDLTQDQRYSMSPATKQLLETMPEPVTVTVYLAGDFPPAFRRLSQATRETLDEMQVHAGSKLRYVFVDPSAATSEADRNKEYQRLIQKGLRPTNLGANEGGKRVEKIIFPWATIAVGNKEENVLLLRGNQAAPPDVRLNQSIEGLEYELAAAVRRLQPTKRQLIGIVEGHGEPDNLHLADLIGTLQRDYNIYRIDLNKVKDQDMKSLAAVIVAKPERAFTDPEKFKLDEFITQGGRALFFVDAMRVNLDSANRGGMLSFPLDLNLTDLLFTYGARLNGDLLLDVNSGLIPLVTGSTGDKPQVQPMPWPFYPLVNNFSPHPITRNLDAVYLKFVGTIDTVKAAGIRKTPLMFTSRYTRVLPAPVPINLNDARLPPDPKLYKSGPKPVGYLLEGQFRSLFANRAKPGTTQFLPAQSPLAKPSKILVVSDGDFVRNDVDPKTNRPLRLGFDRLATTEFANRELVQNAVDYLLDETGLIDVRSKQITLRPLDKVKINAEKRQWQLLNLGAPLALLAVFGLVRAWLRKRKYASFGVE